MTELQYKTSKAPRLPRDSVGLGRAYSKGSEYEDIARKEWGERHPYDKGKEAYHVNEREMSSSTTPRDSIDMEKAAHPKEHGHGQAHSHENVDPFTKPEYEIEHMYPPGHEDSWVGPRPKLSFRTRLHHFTWAWYTLTMSTGGLATLIAIQPHAFPGLITIGAVLFVFNLILFTFVCTMMLLRFSMHPGSLKESLKHEREGLFFPTFWLSVATIITGTQKYVIQPLEAEHEMRAWLLTSMAIAFWLYAICTFLLAVIQYSYLFIGHTYLLTKFMPSWLLPIFPIMLAGTIASVIAVDQPLASRLPILVAGVACQGLGFTVAVLMYAHYIGRLMQVGLPNREHRGAMFIGVGPPSFTALALIGMANALPPDFEIQGDGFIEAGMIRTLALLCAVFLYALAMWFFMISLVAVLHSRPKFFHCGWWAMVFPNTGFTIATISIGGALRSEGVLFAGNIMTIGIVIMWIFVLTMHIRAVWFSDIMYPGRDEDVAD